MKKTFENDPDIFSLITKIQEQIAALDKKVDYLINKPSTPLVQVRPSPQRNRARSIFFPGEENYF